MTERRGRGRGWRLVRAGRDAVPASVRRFGARARRRRLRAALPWLVAAGLAVLVGAAAAVVYATPLLGVAHVRVEGAVIARPEDVRAAAALAPGTPLARVDTAAVARRVSRLAPVARAIVLRQWPDTVVVRVVERTAVAAVPAGAGYDLVDGSGVVFRTATGPGDLPVVRVAAPGPGDASTRAALSVLGSLTPTLRAQLVALVAEAPTRVRLELRAGRSVIWGDASDNETKSRVATSLLSRPGRVIDVSAPGVVTVR
jgi:cell division protein FtsQ